MTRLTCRRRYQIVAWHPHTNSTGSSMTPDREHQIKEISKKIEHMRFEQAALRLQQETLESAFAELDAKRWKLVLTP